MFDWNIALSVLRSFLPWRRHQKTPNPRCLQITMQRQWTSYSCTAAVAQMLAGYFGEKMSHREAIQLTKCKPDGAQLGDVAKALKRHHGLRPRILRKSQVRGALKRGEPVMSNDDQSYVDNHAILLIGETPKGFYVADSAVGEIYWRHQKRFFAGADEFIAFQGPLTAARTTRHRRVAESRV